MQIEQCAKRNSRKYIVKIQKNVILGDPFFFFYVRLFYNRFFISFSTFIRRRDVFICKKIPFPVHYHAGRFGYFTCHSRQNPSDIRFSHDLSVNTGDAFLCISPDSAFWKCLQHKIQRAHATYPCHLRTCGHFSHDISICHRRNTVLYSRLLRDQYAFSLSLAFLNTHICHRSCFCTGSFQRNRCSSQTHIDFWRRKPS